MIIELVQRAEREQGEDVGQSGFHTSLSSGASEWLWLFLYEVLPSTRVRAIWDDMESKDYAAIQELVEVGGALGDQPEEDRDCTRALAKQVWRDLIDPFGLSCSVFYPSLTADERGAILHAMDMQYKQFCRLHAQTYSPDWPEDDRLEARADYQAEICVAKSLLLKLGMKGLAND